MWTYGTGAEHAESANTSAERSAAMCMMASDNGLTADRCKGGQRAALTKRRWDYHTSWVGVQEGVEAGSGTEGRNGSYEENKGQGQRDARSGEKLTTCNCCAF
jgi:hypothetical protein